MSAAGSAGIATIIAIILIVSGCVSVPAETTAPVVDWTARYGVLLLDDNEASYLGNREGNKIIESRRDGTAVLVPAEDAKLKKQRGYRTMTDPPFRYIDPAISKRRSSNKAEVWWSGYKDEIIVEKLLNNLAKNYPDYTQLNVIGKSHNGRPIYALTLADRKKSRTTRPVFMYNGAHHGNEPLSMEYVLDLARSMLSSVDAINPAEVVPIKLSSDEKRKYRYFLDNFEVWCVPMVNPDGVNIFWNQSQFAGRRNGRDVDINRNYPFYWNSGVRTASSDKPGSVFYRGPGPGSEPETRAMMKLAEEHRFTLSISFHTFATKVLIPYTADGALTPVPAPGRRLGHELVASAKSFRPDKEYVAVRNLYPVDGTDQDWLYHEFGTMAFIVEGSYQTPDFEKQGLLSIEGMRPLSRRAMELYKEGPTIQVTVLDANDRPAFVRIRRLDQTLMEEEKFTTNPDTGRYDFMLEESGETTIQIVYEVHGKPAQILKKVACAGGICPVTIRLTGNADEVQWAGR